MVIGRMQSLILCQCLSKEMNSVASEFASRRYYLPFVQWRLRYRDLLIPQSCSEVLDDFCGELFMRLLYYVRHSHMVEDTFTYHRMIHHTRYKAI